MTTAIIPNFFIVGAAKCGTTALYEYLRRHPQIFMPKNKEPRFFGQDLGMIRWRRPNVHEYLELFRGAEGYPLVGEASVQYLLSKSAAAEIRQFSPGAKIIIMIRDPVESMYSIHGQLLFGFSEDIRDFSAALDAETERVQGKRLPKFAAYREQCLYRYRVRYAEQIERFVQEFTWASVHVVLYDDFKADPNKVYQEVLVFLGADGYSLPEYPRVNASKRRRIKWMYNSLCKLKIIYRLIDPDGKFMNYRLGRDMKYIINNTERLINVVNYRRPMLAINLEQRLRRELAPEVEQLGNLVSRDLSHWSRVLRQQ